MKAHQAAATEAKQAQKELMKKAEQIANDEAGILARASAVSDPYQSRVGFTAKQLQEKADARLAKELKKANKALRKREKRKDRERDRDAVADGAGGGMRNAV